jgi:hypothetical protein
MKNIALVIIALFALGASAHAGTITFTLTTAQGTVTKTYTDTDANIAKIGTANGANCQASNLVGTPPVPTACTNAQVVTWWFNSLISGTVSNVTTYLQQAQVQALTPVTPINPQ